MDLKITLTLRIAAVALLSLLTISGACLYQSDMRVRSELVEAAEKIGTQLDMQVIRIRSNFDLPERFPDWQAFATGIAAPGLCIEFAGADKQIVARQCHGRALADAPPQWFETIQGLVFPSAYVAKRNVRYRDQDWGWVVVSYDRDAVVQRSWTEAAQMVSPSAATALMLCLLAYGAIARALAPTRQVLAGLARLAAGDLTCRLPPVRIRELQRISEAFNTLAVELDRSKAERADLAARLVNGQEEERRYLARELHDEFGQSLTAISAIAASIRISAERDLPEIAPEAQSIASIAGDMMTVLHQTLERLRPPEIDELGLCEALKSMVAGWNLRLRGQVRVECDIDRACSDLPMTIGVNIYRIAQECVTNAVKHAGASLIRVSVNFGASPRAIELSVADDGRSPMPPTAAGNRTGIAGMTERALALGGRLWWESAQPTGTIMRCRIPATTIPA